MKLRLLIVVLLTLNSCSFITSTTFESLESDHKLFYIESIDTTNNNVIMLVKSLDIKDSLFIKSFTEDGETINRYRARDLTFVELNTENDFYINRFPKKMISQQKSTKVGINESCSKRFTLHKLYFENDKRFTFDKDSIKCEVDLGFATNIENPQKGKRIRTGQSSFPHFQATSVPLKFQTNDDFNLRSAASLSIGFGQKNDKVYRRPYFINDVNETVQLINVKENRFSYSTLLIFGLATENLNENNTELGTFQSGKSKQVPMGTIGGAILSSYNKVGIGISGGVDHGFNDESKYWKNQNQFWIGTVIGLDLIK